MSGSAPPDDATPRVRSTGITVLAVLALFYTLYFARGFLLPVTFALLLAALLNPVVRALARIRVPSPVAAGLIIVVLVGIGGLGVYELSGPVQRWAENAPETLQTAQGKLRSILRPIARVTAQVESVTNPTGVSEKPVEAVVRGPTLVARLFGSTQRFLGDALEVLILLFFLLAAGDLFLDKLIKVLPNVRDKHKAFAIAHETEELISIYLLTAAAVNVVEGAVVAGAMVSLAFWFWIWGIPGAFIAVPLLATFKIFCDHIDALAGVGEFLGALTPSTRARLSLRPRTRS